MVPLKIMTWNVEQFNGAGGGPRETREARRDRLARIITMIEQEAPDVFGISEVRSKFVYEAMVNAFPDHTFHITTGAQSMEILIGVRPQLGSFFTQKDKFKRNNIYLRPGALLTVREGDVIVPILFLHLKSHADAEGFGLRDAMLEQVYSLKRALDKEARRLADDDDAVANFIVLGDLNTMGLDYYRNANDIPGKREIEVLQSKMNRRGMRKPRPSHPFTFYNTSASRYPPAELDHLFAAEHIRFATDDAGHEVQVTGWTRETTIEAMDEWVTRYSDHAPLIATITGFDRAD